MYRKGDRIGPYILLEKLGRGTFGIVWLAENSSAFVAPKVAVKIPYEDDVDLNAIKSEATTWVAASGNANILPIIEANIYDDQVVIVSEYAPDGSLEHWLRKNEGKSPNINLAIEMMRGILSGLVHLHSRNIIHRDLKPANIMLQGETPRLADFGLARILKETKSSTNVSGTYAYMSPEAFKGKRSQQADIWSAGIILYEMLTGQLPFSQPDNVSLMAAVITEEPKPLPLSIPQTLRDVVNKALQKEPSLRYSTAEEMRSSLTAARDEIDKEIRDLKQKQEATEATTEVLSWQNPTQQEVYEDMRETKLMTPNLSFSDSSKETKQMPLTPTLSGWDAAFNPINYEPNTLEPLQHKDTIAVDREGLEKKREATSVIETKNNEAVKGQSLTYALATVWVFGPSLVTMLKFYLQYFGLPYKVDQYLSLWIIPLSVVSFISLILFILSNGDNKEHLRRLAFVIGAISGVIAWGITIMLLITVR